MGSARHNIGSVLASFTGRFKHTPPSGGVRFGSLRRLTPISPAWGFDRGGPLDRYYIETFLAQHASDIQGRVLEIGDDAYTRKFGNGRVRQVDVLHAVPGNPKATIVADLSNCDSIPASGFDCIVLTQTIQMIYDMTATVRNIHRILKPGGVALVTASGISKLDLKWNDQWHLTSHGARRLFGEFFPPQCLTIEAHGNVLTAIAYLHGLSHRELRKRELDFHDPAYELLVTVRAVKPAE